MKIGQICLATPSDEISEQFASLVEALARHDIEQHVLVASVALAQRLAACDSVTVGPVVKSPVMAYCLTPTVDLAHVHEIRSGQAGLLLTLTRSIPFVITTRANAADSRNPLTRSVLHRAADTISDINTRPARQAAAEHLRIYHRAIETWRGSTLLL